MADENMETLNLIVRWTGSIGCLLVASWLIFNSLVWIRFFDYGDRRKLENRWRNDNKAGRLAGVGMFILFVVVMNMWSGPVTELNSWLSMVFLFMLFLVGVLDDILSVDWLYRLILYSIISMTLAVLFYTGFVSYLFYSLVILFFINSFNMLDNMDLVGAITLTQVFVCASIVTGDVRLVVFVVLLLPFFEFNRLGKLMMGDCGSTVIGALFGILAVWMLSHSVSVYSVFLIFIIPIVDTSCVVLRRLIEGRLPWIGGTDHLTHSLARHIGTNKMLIGLFVFGFLSGMIGVFLR